MIGNRYGNLIVIAFSHVNKHRSKCFLCQCDCGNKKVINRNELTSGKTLSCGCYNRKRVSETHSGKGNYNYIDGRRKTKLYRVWRGMIERCTDPKHISYKYYGAKGITVCDEWANSFPIFRDWALNAGYKDGLSVDRKQSKEGYSPDNCQIMTRSENTAKGNRERKLL